MMGWTASIILIPVAVLTAAFSGAAAMSAQDSTDRGLALFIMALALILAFLALLVRP